MAASAAVEEHLSARTEPRHDVLEVRHRGSGATKHSGIQRAAPHGEQAEREKSAADLEAPVGNVLVRNPVACDMEGRPEQEGERPGSDERAERASGRDMQRNDHRADDRLCSEAMSLGNWFKRLFSSGDGEPDVKAAAEGTETSAGGVGPGIPGTPAAAEAAEAEIEAEEPPSEPGP